MDLNRMQSYVCSYGPDLMISREFPDFYVLDCDILLKEHENGVPGAYRVRNLNIEVCLHIPKVWTYENFWKFFCLTLSQELVLKTKAFLDGTDFYYGPHYQWEEINTGIDAVMWNLLNFGWRKGLDEILFDEDFPQEEVPALMVEIFEALPERF